MIKSLKFINFQDLVECQSATFCSKEAFLPITYEFKPSNTYGLVSDFGCGSWGLSYCIGGKTSKQYNGKILLNGEEIMADELSQHSCFITEINYTDLSITQETSSPKECIEKALSISLLPYSVSQIKTLFCLSNDRFERPLAYVSGERWFITMAINFALGKQIFCFPWLNERDIVYFEIAYKQGIIKQLTSLGKIIIVPSSQKQVLRKYCDHIVIFDKQRIAYR